MSPDARLMGIAMICVAVAASLPAVAEPPSKSTPIAGLQPLSKGDLGQMAGGAETLSLDNLNLVTNQATNNSTVTGNTIGNIGGTGTISSTSMSQTSGFTTLIANSGNQVSITQSTIVNVYLH